MRWATTLAAVPLLLTGACTADTGVLELNWVFVDDRFATIYPSGDERDTCDLSGVSGSDERLFDMRVRVRVSDPTCEGGPGDAECRVLDPIVFPCNRARGTEMGVPASDEDLRFDVDVVVVPRGGGAFVPTDECVTHPGPRLRPVPEGLITDLAVYQMVVHAMELPRDNDDSGVPFDLFGCNPANEGMEPP